MEGETYAGELSEEQIFFRQLMQISSLSSVIFEDTGTGWQRGLRNYVAAIDNLESTSIRHLDDEYNNKLMQLSARFKARMDKYHRDHPQRSLTSVGKQAETRLTFNFANRKLALIVGTLNRKGVFNQTQYQAVDDGIFDNGTNGKQ